MGTFFSVFWYAHVVGAAPMDRLPVDAAQMAVHAGLPVGLIGIDLIGHAELVIGAGIPIDPIDHAGGHAESGFEMMQIGPHLNLA